MNAVYLLALGSNLGFALASQAYTHFSRKVSSAWMNFAKTLGAFFLFFVFILTFGEFHTISNKSIGLFFLSGLLGLGAGDWFLLKAYSLMGAGRTLMLFAFQPIFIGTMAYLYLGQETDLKNIWAILFFIFCLFTFSLESFKKKGHWEIKGIILALLAIFFDGIGVLITRYVFDQNPSISSFEGNFYRCIGAVLFFSTWTLVRPIGLRKNFSSQDLKSKFLLIAAVFLGTFLSLALYLEAIKMAHLASLSGIAITGTIFANLFECLIERKWPSKYLIVAFGFFLIGMKILIFS
jgi:drug/metabolite transporter (DMT)-like permease